MTGVAYSLGRMLVPAVFIISGVQMFMNVGEIARTLAGRFPLPVEIERYLGGLSRYETAGYLLAAIQTLCAIMVLVGLKARWGAWVLLIISVASILLAHKFWTLAGAAALSNQPLAIMNLSIMGGLLLIIAGGSHGSFNGRPS
jgi:putative oxidoreductase